MRAALAVLPVPVRSTSAARPLWAVDQTKVLYVRGWSAGFKFPGAGQYTLRARPPSPCEAVLSEILNSVVARARSHHSERASENMR